MEISKYVIQVVSIVVTQVWWSRRICEMSKKNPVILYVIYSLQLISYVLPCFGMMQSFMAMTTISHKFEKII